MRIGMITTEQEVYKYCGIELELSRDNLLTEQGLRYLTTEGFYKKPNETTPQETFACSSLLLFWR